MIEELERLPLSRFHYTLLLVVGIPYTFVAMDLLLISQALPLLRGEWVLPGELAGFLAGSVFIGMFIGAASWGYLADILGRKKALEFTILIYTLSTGLSSLAWNWPSMILFRILTGIGLGGCIPLCFVFLAEYIPARGRGRFLVLLDSFWAYGWILAALLGYLVIKPLGWRYFFLTGAIPIITLPLIHFMLPESIRYLEEKGLVEEARRTLSWIRERVGIASLGEGGGASKEGKMRVRDLWSKPYRRRTAFTWIMWFTMVYGYYSLFLWIVSFMGNMGLPVPTALWYALLTSLAQIPGYFSAAWLIEAWGRKPTLTTYLLLTAASTLGFSTAKTSMEIIAWLSAISFFCLGAWGVVMTYSSEVYPTRVRGTGYGAASGFGRLAGIIGPTLVGFILQAYSLTTALLVTSGVFLLGALNASILGMETKGKTLEEISR